MTDPVLQTVPLGFQWATVDPFLFCVHHLDAYPVANEHMGPAASLAGREIGADFAGIDGWRMYHGSSVPGFPQHPHRGFETVTFVRQGLIDHSDSLGATARFGRGDVQWLTAGRGIVHSEMFPLLDREHPNTCELFQIWVNLPAADKMVDPYFTMLWNEDLPRHIVTDREGRTAEITIIAGELAGLRPPPPPPDSWASRPEADLAIWHLVLEPGAQSSSCRRRAVRRRSAPSMCSTATCASAITTLPHRRVRCCAPRRWSASPPDPAARRRSCCRAGRSASRSRSTGRSS